MIPRDPKKPPASTFVPPVPTEPEESDLTTVFVIAGVFSVILAIIVVYFVLKNKKKTPKPAVFLEEPIVRKAKKYKPKPINDEFSISYD